MINKFRPIKTFQIRVHRFELDILFLPYMCNTHESFRVVYSYLENCFQIVFFLLGVKPSVIRNLFLKNKLCNSVTTSWLVWGFRFRSVQSGHFLHSPCTALNTVFCTTAHEHDRSGHKRNGRQATWIMVFHHAFLFRFSF